MKPMVEMRVRSVRSEKSGFFRVTIESPKQDPEKGDFYCRVRSTDAILGFHVDAYGVIPQQAIRLALEVAAAKVANILVADATDDLSWQT